MPVVVYTSNTRKQELAHMAYCSFTEADTVADTMALTVALAQLNIPMPTFVSLALECNNIQVVRLFCYPL